MDDDLKQNLEAVYFTLAGFSSFSCCDALYKSMNASYPFQNNVFFVASFALLFLLALSPIFGGPLASIKTRKLGLHMFRALLLVPQGLLAIYAFGQLPLADVYAILFLSPLISAFLALIVLKEKIQPYKVIAIYTGFLGVLIILRPGMVPISFPVIATLLSAVLFSLSTIIVRKIGRTRKSLAFAVYPTAGMIPVAFVMAMPTFEWPTLNHLFVLAMTGIAAANGSMCLSKGFSMAPTALVAPVHYIQIIWGMVLGYIFFGDILDFWTGLGSAIIILSGLYLIYKDKKNVKPPVPLAK